MLPFALQLEVLQKYYATKDKSSARFRDLLTDAGRTLTITEEGQKLARHKVIKAIMEKLEEGSRFK